MLRHRVTTVASPWQRYWFGAGWLIVPLLTGQVSHAATARLLLYCQGQRLANSQQIVSNLQAALATQLSWSSTFQAVKYDPTASAIKEAVREKRLVTEDLQQIGDPAGLKKILTALGVVGGILVNVERVQTLDGVDLGLDASVTLVSPSESASFHIAARASKYEAKYATGSERRTVYDVAAQQIANEIKARSSIFRSEDHPGGSSPAEGEKTTRKPGVTLPDLTQSSDNDTALRALAEASAASPHDPSLYISAGDIYLKKGQIDYAVLEYRRAVYVDPKNRSALLKLAQTYAQRGQISRSLETAQRMIGLGYDDAQIRYLMAQGHLALKAFHDSNGRVQASENELDKALEEFQKAVVLDRNDVEIFLAYGKQLLTVERFKDAALIYQRASELAPKNAEVWQSLALSLLGTDDYRGGVESLVRSLELRGTSVVAIEPETYRKILRLTDGYAREIYLQTRTNLTDFTDKKLAAETMLLRAQKLCDAIGKLSTAMNNIDPPVGQHRPHLQRTLSYQLLEQAMLSVVSFVETNDTSYQEKAALLLTEFANQYEAARTKSVTQRDSSTLSG